MELSITIRDIKRLITEMMKPYKAGEQQFKLDCFMRAVCSALNEKISAKPNEKVYFSSSYKDLYFNVGTYYFTVATIITRECDVRDPGTGNKVRATTVPFAVRIGTLNRYTTNLKRVFLLNEMTTLAELAEAAGQEVAKKKETRERVIALLVEKGLTQEDYMLLVSVRDANIQLHRALCQNYEAVVQSYQPGAEDKEEGK